MGRWLRVTLARSLFVGAAFAVTAVLMSIFGQAPDRSVADWAEVTLVLALLSIASGLTVTFCEFRLR